MSAHSREILRVGDFAYWLHTKPVASIPGTISVRVTSSWSQAKKPQDEFCKLSLTLGRNELKALIQGLQEALAQA